MNVRSSLILLGASASLLGTASHAQRVQERTSPPRSHDSLDASASLGQRLRVGGTPTFAEYDLDTASFEMLEPDQAPAELRSMAAGCFSNDVDPDGWADALLYPAGNELLDWGVKNCSGSNFVDRIRIGFASFAKPVSQGGPGGRFILRIYSGTTGNGTFGHLLRELTLTGLPAAGFEPSGLLIPSYVVVNLGADAFFLPDGPIGWSYENFNGKSAPLLVDVVPSLGTELAYDVYNPGPANAASYSGTFTLGPGGQSNDPSENSFHIEIFQNDVTALATYLPAAGNPDLLVAGAPIVGSTWRAWIDLSGVPGARVSLLALSAASVNQPTPSAGVLLVDPAALLQEVSVGVVDAHRYRIPSDASLLGTKFYAQGGYFGRAGLQLTNGAELTIGSF